jgi:hypothetical protein
MVLGDLNAKVGKGESNYPYAGRNGLHEECNGNGCKMVVCMRDVRCKRGVIVDSDLHLVMANIQARISTNKIHRAQRVQKYNVQSLENEEVQRTFRNKITELNESSSAVEEGKGNGKAVIYI